MNRLASNRLASNRLAPVVWCLVIFLAASAPGRAADLDALVAALKEGGYVLVLRHGATDDSQKDIYPFKFDDMAAQRQLNDTGRSMARRLGEALRKLGVPIGEVYTSQLNRAVETGKLMGGKDVSPIEALTDSGAGSSSAMANPDGKNARTGRTIRDLVNTPPRAGFNNLAVTHKTNVADAFGKEFADIREGEALVYKTGAAGPAVLIARVQASEWIARAGG